MSDGEKAIEAYKKSAVTIDLVLMDCEMPHMDGYQSTREIRKFEQANNLVATNIVALSAHALTEHKKKAYDAGMDMYLSKPIRNKDLMDLFTKLGFIAGI